MFVDWKMNIVQADATLDTGYTELHLILELCFQAHIFPCITFTQSVYLFILCIYTYMCMCIYTYI